MSSSASPATAVAATATVGSTTNTNTNSADRPIQILPQIVVDRIAAGEVVQRPVSAVKELCENSLDAGASLIRVVVNSVDAFTVHDNGRGISVRDLPLACTRHATSKISTADDLQKLQSFGFRGEALASLSMVAQVKIVSKTANNSSACAYQLQFRDGAPCENQPDPTPTARTVGTTIYCTDLFANLPHRRRALRAADEYRAILQTVSLYAIHYAQQGVAFHCQQQQQQNKSTSTDLNTSPAVAALQRHSSLTNNNPNSETSSTVRDNATKQVIGQIFGSQLVPHLLAHSSELLSLVDPATLPDSPPVNCNEDSKPFIYTCTGFVTSPSYHQLVTGTSSASSNTSNNNNKKSSTTKRTKSACSTKLVLFINHRLVDGCTSLKRSIEEAYAEFVGSQQIMANRKTGKKPFVYLSLMVPPDTVDVNVHPTKRDVTLLHLEQIAQHLGEAVRTILRAAGQSFGVVQPVRNPYLFNQAKNNSRNDSNGTGNNHNPIQSTKSVQSSDPTSAAIRKRPPDESDDDDDDDDSNNNNNVCDLSAKPPPSQPPPRKKSMVRTSRATQAGSIEPYLVHKTQTQPLSQTSRNNTPLSTSQHSSAQSQLASQTQQGETETQSPTTSTSSARTTPKLQHDANCPLSTPPTDLDLSQPGAFAVAAAQCTCRTVTAVIPVANNNEAAVVPAGSNPKRLRLQRFAPTVCRYTSIQKLRASLQKNRSVAWEQRLRQACFVGTVSHDRSLLQCGSDLVLVHHTALAQELFAQLALHRFGGGSGVARIQKPSTAGDDDDEPNATSSAPDNDANQHTNHPDSGSNQPAAARRIVSELNNNDNVGIDIQAVVAAFVQFEETLQNDTNLKEPVPSPSLPQISDANQILAGQVADCLLQHAEMLAEYFSIEIVADDQDRARLMGLPVLLEGYEPSPHGLSLFLLRLAMEVDWNDEKSCFAGVCRELGAYYGQLPSDLGSTETTTRTMETRDPHAARVRHILFPAISTLLIPTEHMVPPEDRTMRSGTQGGGLSYFTILTSLPKLYKVFERC